MRAASVAAALYYTNQSVLTSLFAFQYEGGKLRVWPGNGYAEHPKRLRRLTHLLYQEVC
jgi:hypothetical protein